MLPSYAFLNIFNKSTLATDIISIFESSVVSIRPQWRRWGVPAESHTEYHIAFAYMQTLGSGFSYTFARIISKQPGVGYAFELPWLTSTTPGVWEGFSETDRDVLDVACCLLLLFCLSKMLEQFSPCSDRHTCNTEEGLLSPPHGTGMRGCGARLSVSACCASN